MNGWNHVVAALGACLAVAAGCSSEPEEGACVVTFEQRDECHTRSTAERCKTYGENIEKRPSTRFVPVAQEDRDRAANIGATGDLTPRVCQRLGYLSCQQASGICSRR